MNGIARLLIIVAVLGFVALVASCSGMTVIDPGYRGVKVVNGKTDNEPLPQGRYFYLPLTTRIVEVNVAPQTHGTEGDAVITLITKDLQQAKIAFSFNASLNPADVVAMYDVARENWYDVMVANLVVDAMGRVASTYDAPDLNEMRGEAAGKMEQALRDAIATRLKASGLNPQAIQVNGMAIRSLTFSDDYMNTVEQKATAVQQAEKAKNDTVTLTEQAKQQVIAAQAQADSDLAKAKAEAEGIRIKNEALSQSPKLIDLTYAEAAKIMAARWSGAVPSVVVGSGEGQTSAFPFLNLTDVIKSAK